MTQLARSPRAWSAAVLALALAGCGGDAGSGSTGASGSAKPDAAASTAATDNATSVNKKDGDDVRYAP